MEHTLELESRIIEVVQDTIDNEELTKEEIEQGFIYFSENTLTLHGTQSTRDYITACIDNINSKFDLNLKRKDCKVSNHKEDVYHEYVWK